MATADAYEQDVLLWSEQQGALLRRMAAGQRLNQAPDWANIIDEVEAVGREQRHAVESLLVQALAHRLKAEGWPEARDVAAWRADARRFLDEARDRLTPSMRPRIDMARVCTRAVRAVPDLLDGRPPRPGRLSRTGPLTLDDLLGDDA